MNQLFGHPTDAPRGVDSDLGSTTLPPRPLPVGGAEQAFFHLDIKRSLQLHWRLARNIAIGGVALAILYFAAQVYVFHAWPAYEAESMVYVQPTPPKVFEPTQGGSPRWPYDTNTYESYIQQQMMNVTRDDVLASALKKIGDFQEKGESEQQAAQRLAQALSVTREGTSYDFAIGARAGSAEFAADIANDVTAAYMESTARDQHTGDAQRLAMLGDEKDRISKALDADRAEQESLNRQLGVASVGSAVPDHYDEDISSTRTELIKARTDHDAAEAKFAAFDAGHGPSSAAIDAAADEIIATDAGLVSMKTSLNQRRATLISQMANLTPSHPQYKQDEVELGKINNELDSMMKDLRSKAAARIQLQLQSDLQRTAGVEAQVNGQLRQLVGAAGSATPKMQRSGDLASDITRLQARFATVDEQLHNLLLEDSAPSAAYQVTPAVPPLYRTKTGVLRNVILIIFAGIFFGVLGAVVANKLDPKVYIAKDVELILGFPPMAQLPDFNEVTGGVAEEYLLRLASSIEHARKQSQLRSCVFTGTGAGNGVTMLVNRVGEMLQAMGRPTVLVDASGAPVPQGHPLQELQGTPGLVPVQRISRPTALLQQMAEESETQDESLVLTDTAPLPVSAETEYLARFVDCAIVVIQSGKTTRRELRAAAATLQRLDVAAVGFILNRVGLAKADPAFRESVQAIEKHLETQASHSTYRPETVRSSAVDEPWLEEKLPAAETSPEEGSSRALFEAELAAAGAAVERLSHPVHAESKDSEHEPDAVEASANEATAKSEVRHLSPLSYEEFIAAEHLNPPAEINDFVHLPSTPPAEEEAFETSPAPAVAPFMDAARHASSNFSAEPSLLHWSVAESAPFTYKADHLTPAHLDESVISAPSADEQDAVAATQPELDHSEVVHAGIRGQEAEHLEAEHPEIGHPEIELLAPENHEAENHEAESQEIEPREIEHEAVEHPEMDLSKGDLSHAAEEHSSFIAAYLLKPGSHREASPEDDSQEEPIWNLYPDVPAAEDKHKPVAATAAAMEATAVHAVEAAPITSVLATGTQPESALPDPILVASGAAESAAVESAQAKSEPLESAQVVPIQIESSLAEASPVEQVQEEIVSTAKFPAPREPWWLSEVTPHRVPNRPPVLWKPAKVSMLNHAAQAADPTTEGQDVAAEPLQPWAVPAQSWKPIVNTSLHRAGLTMDGEYASEQDQTSANLSSRLSGLRNLLFVLGVKNAQDGNEPGERLSNIGSNFDLRVQRQANDAHDPSSQEQSEEMPPISIGGASPRLVTAPPEFLPPKTVSISSGRDEAGSPTDRMDRRASYDDVEILPSRKGQYKKI